MLLAELQKIRYNGVSPWNPETDYLQGLLEESGPLSHSEPDKLFIPIINFNPMNREWHLLIGGIAFLFYQVFIDSINSSIHYPWLYGVVLLALGSVLPDELEPAYDRYHRGICHSLGALYLVIVLFVISALITSFSSAFPNHILIYLASCFFLGYVFHLLADSTTTMGLPK
jgi:membrane-bound metal-dependent hydrolase YbcI (DUF457 family)